MKKLFAILLTIMIALCAFGMPVAADDFDTPETPIEPDEYVVKPVYKTEYWPVGNISVLVTISGSITCLSDGTITAYNLSVTVSNGSITYLYKENCGTYIFVTGTITIGNQGGDFSMLVSSWD